MVKVKMKAKAPEQNIMNHKRVAWYANNYQQRCLPMTKCIHHQKNAEVVDKFQLFTIASILIGLIGATEHSFWIFFSLLKEKIKMLSSCLFSFVKQFLVQVSNVDQII